MYRWLNPSHPQTLQAGVFLGYLSAIFTLLFGVGSPLGLLLAIGLGVGAFGTANNKRWAFWLLAVAAGIRLLLSIIPVLFSAAAFNVIPTLFWINALVFPAALFAAVMHAHSRQYQRIWFE
jgi:hypothetical protein